MDTEEDNLQQSFNSSSSTSSCTNGSEDSNDNLEAIGYEHGNGYLTRDSMPTNVRRSIERFPVYLNPSIERGVVQWAPGPRLRGTVVQEAAGYGHGNLGIIRRLDSDGHDDCYYNVGIVEDCNHLLLNDEVVYQLRTDDNNSYASIVALERRENAIGVVSNVLNSAIFFEIVALRNELSIPIGNVNENLHSLNRGDEVVCDVICIDGSYEIINLQRFETGTLQPLRVLQPLIYGIVVKPIYASILTTNPYYYGHILFNSQGYCVVLYGLMSQRNRNEVFTLGDHVVFKLAAFHLGRFYIAYDMIDGTLNDQDAELLRIDP